MKIQLTLDMGSQPTAAWCNEVRCRYMGGHPMLMRTVKGNCFETVGIYIDAHRESRSSTVVRVQLTKLGKILWAKHACRRGGKLYYRPDLCSYRIIKVECI